VPARPSAGWSDVASKTSVPLEKPWRIFTPDKQDDGLLEFYAWGMHQPRLA